MRFVDFEFALTLALSLKHFASQPLIVGYYRNNLKYINDFCKKIRNPDWWDCEYHLELLSYSDFFRQGDDDYLFLRKFIYSYIINCNDFYQVHNFDEKDLFLCLTCV